jgi:hypothetical protein
MKAMVRRLVLIGSVCGLAAAIAPIASASAAEETVTGTCSIKGKAKFTPGLSKNLARVKYNFEGDAAGTSCSPNGPTGVKTNVSGEAELQCAVAAGGIEVGGASVGAAGKGTLRTGGAPEYKFELTFAAQAGVVDLLARPEGTELYTATGEAEFLTTNKATAIVACAQSSLTELEFEAQTAGVI